MLKDYTNRLRSLNPWHFLWITVLLSEIFTAAINSVQSFLRWGFISRELLIIGAIDSLFVPLIVGPIIIYFVEKTKELTRANEQLIRENSRRRQAEERISQQVRKLSSLRSIDLAISSSFNLPVILTVFIDHVVNLLGVDAADVLLLNPQTKTLEYAASSGFRTNALKYSRLRLGEGYAGVAAMENRLVNVSNLNEDTIFKPRGILSGEDFRTYYGVPLVAKGRVKGVLEILHRSPLEPDQEWLEFLDALALQAAIAIDNNSLLSDLERSNMELSQAYDSTIEGWSRALDYRDKETEGHSRRVAEITLRIAGAFDRSSRSSAGRPYFA